MSYLIRSSAAANMFPAAKDVIFDTMFSDYASSRLKGLGMQFFIWVLGQASVDNMKAFAPDLFAKLLDKITLLASTKRMTIFMFYHC